MEFAFDIATISQTATLGFSLGFVLGTIANLFGYVIHKAFALMDYKDI